MIARLFPPIPDPRAALFGVIGTILSFGFLGNASGIVRGFGALVLTGCAYLLVCFVRGLRLDLAIHRDGLVTPVRITRIEEHRRRGHPWWSVHFTFTDAAGVVHENDFAEEEEGGGTKWKVGQTAQIRYHPAAPSIFRILE